jgi:hypothetical protein
MTQVDTFEVFDEKATAENPIFKTESQKPDPIWTDRITPLNVGYSFRVTRVDGETVRQLKKRINRAAGVSFKTLEWKPEDQNVDSQDAKRFIVRVKALDLKAKAAAEAKARQNGQEAPSQTQGTKEGENTPTTPSGPRAARNAS